MADENTIWIEKPPVCKHLRSKQFYMDLGFHSSGMDSGVSVPCWCFKTQQPRGPDAMFASQEDCLAERECFESA